MLMKDDDGGHGGGHGGDAGADAVAVGHAPASGDADDNVR